jgi:type II secretory pathway component PulF
MILTEHLSVMLKVGITIMEALEILADQTTKAKTKAMYKDIIERIKAGQSLSKSLKKYSYIFSNLFVNMVQTGEEGGNLDEVFEYLSIQLEKEYEMRKKILAAFTYPAVIIGITLTLAVAIVIFIMPKITKIFESFDIELPLPTRILIGFSNLLTQKPFHVLLALFGIIVLFSVIFRLKCLKPFWHRIVLHVPVFGNILISANIARFARTLNSLLQAGVPIADSLKITGNMLDNSLYRRAIEQAGEKVEQGGKLGESFKGNEKLFPRLATQMLYIGERSGSLEITTAHIAKLYETNVDTKTKNLSVLIEPLLLVFMGVLVGGMAISIILPIYQLPNMLGR